MSDVNPPDFGPPNMGAGSSNNADKRRMLVLPPQEQVQAEKQTAVQVSVPYPVILSMVVAMISFVLYARSSGMSSTAAAFVGVSSLAYAIYVSIKSRANTEKLEGRVRRMVGYPYLDQDPAPKLPVNTAPRQVPVPDNRVRYDTGPQPGGDHVYTSVGKPTVSKYQMQLPENLGLDRQQYEEYMRRLHGTASDRGSYYVPPASSLGAAFPHSDKDRKITTADEYVPGAPHMWGDQKFGLKYSRDQLSGNTLHGTIAAPPPPNEQNRNESRQALMAPPRAPQQMALDRAEPADAFHTVPRRSPGAPATKGYSPNVGPPPNTDLNRVAQTPSDQQPAIGYYAEAKTFTHGLPSHALKELDQQRAAQLMEASNSQPRMEERQIAEAQKRELTLPGFGGINDSKLGSERDMNEAIMTAKGR